VIYSLWEGYRQQPALAAFLEGYEVISLHTSGQAAPEALRMMWEGVCPRKRVIPIHGERLEAFRELLPEARLLLLRDGDFAEL